MQVTRTEILKLYKNLMLYSKSLTFTDPAYFRRRVATEFRNNKTLTKDKDITKAKLCCAEVLWCKMLLNPLCRLRAGVVSRVYVAFKHTIDYSKVPKINESDLSEQFVRGSGPGGSAVNKNANCVVLTHIPTGHVVKCHTSRCQDENRKRAREMLVAKLDEELNGEESVAAQKRKLESNKYKKTEYKKKKMAQLKSEWKKREGLA
uniref:SFRICE_007041 n=1 Tax=Spodoptera frugiperda TaxID=7108 RepID=A0A2H1WUA7_SPOFR